KAGTPKNGVAFTRPSPLPDPFDGSQIPAPHALPLRLDEPFCSGAIGPFEKSAMDICKIDSFEPRADTSDRTAARAFVGGANVLLVRGLVVKSVSDFRVDGPEPVAPEGAPGYSAWTCRWR